jgi:hypothetical protein
MPLSNPLSDPYNVGSSKVYFLPSLPTSGYTFNVGDQIWITSPVSGSPIGYICFKAGDFSSVQPEFISISPGVLFTPGNLLANPDFEVDLSSWNPSSTSTITQSSDYAHTGTGSLNIFSSPDNIYQTVTIPLIKTYTFSVWAFAPNSSPANNITLSFLSSTGSTLSSKTINGISSAGWQEYNVTYANTTTNRSVRVQIAALTAIGSSPLYFDDCSLV